MFAAEVPGLGVEATSKGVEFVAKGAKFASKGAETLANTMDSAATGMRQISDKLTNDSPISVAGSKVDGKLYMVPESLKAVAMYKSTDLAMTWG